jgi:tRNA threonylcarbamoyladenosine biosynthesis protein TsaE
MAAWGREFAATLRPGVVVGLSGELGAGKTTLVRAIAAGLGVKESVTSPTFALVHRYDGRVPVWHVDAYRLKADDEARDLGLEEAGEAIVLIEWPERLRDARLTHHIILQNARDGSARELSVA